jgi:hypothetical protein
VDRQVNLLQSRPCGKVQHGLREKPVLDPRRENDGFPYLVEIRVRQGSDVVDALLVGCATFGTITIADGSAARGNALHEILPIH